MSSIIVIEILNIPAHHFGYYFGMNAIIITIASFIAPEFEKKFGAFITVLLGATILFFAGLLMSSFSFFCHLCLTYFLVPMLIASFGVGITSGPATAGALKDFAETAGSASALLGFIRFFIPSIIGTLVMRVDIYSSQPLATSLVCLGLFGMLWSGVYATLRRKDLQQKTK